MHASHAAWQFHQAWCPGISARATLSQLLVVAGWLTGCWACLLPDVRCGYGLCTQLLNLGQLGRAARLALLINIYNMMVLHAFVEVGIPAATLQRLSFFNAAVYELGGLHFTMGEIENGLLRANAKVRRTNALARQHRHI
jgi:hypothetical protein